MTRRDTAQAIADQAAAWVARIDREGDCPAVRSELALWLGGDGSADADSIARRRGAYFRAQAAWQMLDRASVFGAGEGAGAGGLDAAEVAQDTNWPEDAAVRPHRGVRARWIGGFAAAAAAMVVGVFGFGLHDRPDHAIETMVGEIRRVPLADGSLAAVNTATNVDIRLKPEVRRVALRHGEAWFQVAKDPNRPFVVEVGDVRARAIGTAFSVRRLAEGVEVQVTHGLVEVWRIGDEANARRIAAGYSARLDDLGGIATRHETVDTIDRDLSWRSSQLVFDGDTMGAAVGEFNRYNRRKIILRGAQIQDQLVTGRFRTNEPEAFARAAAQILRARAEIGEEKITIIEK